ncbi:MAG: TlyA family RNA methyltransferase [Verrucomicrobia bacterium]|nr:TlyA family RNA methyltransferase [Verrucomicrobiota bacterium]
MRPRDVGRDFVKFHHALSGRMAYDVGMAKDRLDAVMAARGLAESQEKAQRLIRAGMVDVAGQRVDKPGTRVDRDCDCTVRAPPPYVSRGGEKLAAAFAHFPLKVEGRVCMDVGASTGGFTDCLLQRGAAQVYAVDVGKGQLDWKLRQDARVVVMEGVNARYLDAGLFAPKPTVAVIDVAFISLTKVLPAVFNVLAPASQLVMLIKPQFEAERREVEKGGVVRDPAVHARVVEAIRVFCGAQTRVR